MAGQLPPADVLVVGRDPGFLSAAVLAAPTETRPWCSGHVVGTLLPWEGATLGSPPRAPVPDAC